MLSYFYQLHSSFVVLSRQVFLRSVCMPLEEESEFRKEGPGNHALAENASLLSDCGARGIVCLIIKICNAVYTYGQASPAFVRL